MGRGVQRIEMTDVEAPAVPGEPPKPRLFRWRGREFRVAAIIRSWQDQPDRARGAVRPHELRFGAPASAPDGRAYFRVRTDDGSVFDLAYDPEPGSWTLLKQLVAGAS